MFSLMCSVHQHRLRPFQGMWGSTSAIVEWSPSYVCERPRHRMFTFQCLFSSRWNLVVNLLLLAFSQLYSFSLSRIWSHAFTLLLGFGNDSYGFKSLHITCSIPYCILSSFMCLVALICSDILGQKNVFGKRMENCAY